MTILRSTFIAAALMVSPAAFAQDSMTDKAKEMAIDKATDMAKDKAKDLVGSAVDSKTSGKLGTAGALLGKTKAPSAIMDGAKSMSADEAVKAGKIVVGGGSMQDAATTIAKDRAKDKIMSGIKGLATERMPTGGTIKTGRTISNMPARMTIPAPVPAPTTTSIPDAAPAAPAAVMIVNCPSGTTAQPDGTCMITGDYKG